MSELKKYKLGDLGFFFGGVTSIKKEDYGHGTPFLPYKNVYKNSKVNVNELELMNVRPLDLERRNAVYGDIFFTASSETPDEVAMSSVLLDEVENLTFNGFCKRFRLNDFNTLLPEYARYLFRDISFRREVYQLATGDIRFNISQESLANIEIEIPDLPTQRQIAQILTSLDDKIELNLQMNQTLEAMAQAIFKEWFVNFNFPGFDGELVDGLPKGWRMGKLGEICDIKIGRTPPRMETEWFSLDDKDVKWISIKDMGQAGVYLFNTSEYLTKEAIEKFRIPVIPKDTVVISFKLTVGRVSITTENMLSNEAIAHLNTNLFSPEYLYSYLKTYNWGSLGSTSSIATAINSKSIKEMEVLIPNNNVLSQFAETVRPIFEKIKYNSLQIQSLTQTRDTLLPKLMSGQISLNL